MTCFLNMRIAMRNNRMDKKKSPHNIVEAFQIAGS